MSASTPQGPGSGASTSRKSTRVLVVAAILVSTALVVVMGAAAWMLLASSQPISSPGSPVQIEVKQGSSTSEIAQKLIAAQVIGNANAFRLRCRLTGADGKLRSGVYDLTTGMSDADVLAALRAGPSTTYVSVTIPEGFVITQIAQRLEEQADIPAREFEVLATSGASEFAQEYPYLANTYKGSLEGFLFPKTYRIKQGSSAREVAGMMLAQFDDELALVDVKQAADNGLSVVQLVTLASMIERESKLDEERPLVSSVIHNRLKRNMLLKIDATIQYVLGNNRFRLTNRDIQLDTPYNTYLYRGLPPGPISSPGLASLKAAAAPAQTQLLYYVLTGKDGSHTFTTNLADFLIAKKKSKEVFGR